MSKLAKFDIRFLFLLGLMFFLPSVEVPKNLFALLFVFSWVIHCIKNKYWGGKWLVIDSIFLLWILIDILVSINAIITHQLSGDNYRDIIRFVLIAWVLSRTYFSKERLTEASIIALIGTIIALIYGYISGQGELKELHSVGHLNHTAIFLVLAYSISLSLLLFNLKNLKKFQKVTLVVITILLLLSIIDTDSRAAFGLLVIISLIDFFYFLVKKRSKSLSIIFLSVVTFIGILFIFNPPEALERIQAQESFLDDDERSRIRNFSYYAYKANPYLGVGFGNFSQITMDDVKPYIIADKGVFDINLYLESAHPHNVYYNYLTSGGILIFSIFLFFWFYVIWIIFKLNKREENYWIVVSSIGVVMVNLLIGLVNTTLHHEHAILSMFVLGLLISQYRMSELRKNLID